jgi:catechol-2,3-dioxygenase
MFDFIKKLKTVYEISEPLSVRERALKKMKDFYTNILGLEFVSEEKDRCVFLKAGQSMLLIFNPNKTLVSSENSTLISRSWSFCPTINHTHCFRD